MQSFPFTTTSNVKFCEILLSQRFEETWFSNWLGLKNTQKKKKKKETHTKTKANKQGEFMRDKHVVKWLFSLSFTFSYR